MNATAIAPAMTKASEGSQAPPRSRNASTLLALVMPERQRPIPNRRPTRKGDARLMMRPLENVADEEDGEKTCAMKVAVAASERGETRARPQTPCPLVQPLPSRVPKPTSSPPAISVAALASIEGAAGANRKLATSGAAMRPASAGRATASRPRAAE